MRTVIGWMAGLMLSGLAVAAPVPKEIQDASITQVGKLPPRGNHWPHPPRKGGGNWSYGEGPWVRSLNGRWKFHWCARPENRPAEFHRNDFDAVSWGTIPVPSTWEREGHGTPLYVNIKYPFQVDPPRVMGAPDESFTSFKERNPVGSYLREFEVPADWKGMRIILHFGGVRSAMFVWVNGTKIGYSQGSRLPAEFDITDALKPGPNRLAVEVYKFSDASYLEDQDFWRLSGIYRDVFLCALPAGGLWDVYAQPEYDPATGSSKVTLHTTPMPGADPEVQLIYESAGFEPHPPHATAFRLEKVEPWSPENPKIYAGTVQVITADKTEAIYQLPIAYRKLEVVGEELHLNGKPLKIRGVNRHEFFPQTGYVLDEDLMRRDLELMKQANINFVRNAHYPCDPRWYALCDELGLLVMDEANVESHGLSYHKRVLPGDQPEWSAAVVERMERMVIRDRQHPSVVMWSLGNEAGFGTSFLAMREACRKADPEKRLIQYADMNRAGDVDSQTYPPIGWLKQHVAGKAKRKGERGEKSHEEQHGPYPSGRPFLMNEYAHAMGNSIGNFQDYWDLIHTEPMLAGGFIWDWVDQALYRDRRDPEKGFVYGGDFGDVPTDGNFCVNGVIGADRMVHPHYHEVQKVYQPASFDGDGIKDGKLVVTNRHQVTNLQQFAFRYALRADGRVVDSGELPPCDVAPGDAQTIDVSAVAEKAGPAADRGEEVMITFTLKLREETSWAPPGHVVAWEQIPWPVVVLPERELVDVNLAPQATDDGMVVKDGNVALRISFKTGLPDSYVLNGRELLVQPMRWNFWRALTDNDGGWKVAEKLGGWENPETKLQGGALKVSKDAEGRPVMTGVVTIPERKARITVRHTVEHGGVLRIEAAFKATGKKKSKWPGPDLPRLGMQFAIPRELHKVAWYGRGPHENYWDRRSSAPIGLYESTVPDWITPYVRPQENGNRCDVRWLSFTDENGIGLRVDAPRGEPLSVSAWPYSMDDLAKATHDYALPERDFITVNLDHLQMGVGGDNSWGLPVNEPYRIKPDKTYQWSFVLRPAGLPGNK